MTYAAAPQEQTLKLHFELSAVGALPVSALSPNPGSACSEELKTALHRCCNCARLLSISVATSVKRSFGALHCKLLGKIAAESTQCALVGSCIKQPSTKTNALSSHCALALLIRLLINLSTKAQLATTYSSTECDADGNRD